MTVKYYLILAAVLFAVSGCETAKRLAPPGFFKYEDIAKDTPTNPEIQARIDARREGGDSAFPKLSDAPSKKPKPPADDELVQMREDLVAASDDLNEAATEDLAAVEAERARDIAELEARRQQLAEAVARQRREAAREKRAQPE